MPNSSNSSCSARIRPERDQQDGHDASACGGIGGPDDMSIPLVLDKFSLSAICSPGCVKTLHVHVPSPCSHTKDVSYFSSFRPSLSFSSNISLNCETIAPSFLTFSSRCNFKIARFSSALIT